MTDDPVNHPQHYTSSPAKCRGCGLPIECLDITRHMSFPLGNVFKYVWRNAFGVTKGTAVQDFEKAEFYLNDVIERLKANGDS